METIHLLIIPIMLLLLGSLATNAQARYSFTYDASGNRITRNMIVLKRGNIDSLGQQNSKPKTFDDLIGDKPVKIYPNPTKGLLKIEIPLTDEVSARLKIYSTQGSVIKDLPVTDTFTEIDLSNHSSGIYILRIYIGELSSEWKIIKD